MFMFVILCRVCTHVRLGILATSLCVYVCVVVEGIYTCIEGMYRCDAGNFGNKTLCLCLCWCKGYVHM